MLFVSVFDHHSFLLNCTFGVSLSLLFLRIGVAGVSILWHGIVLLLSTWYYVAACVAVL